MAAAIERMPVPQPQSSTLLPLLADMPAFVSVMKEGGALILSGFYPSDAAMLCDKAATLGLTLTAQKINGDWACLMFSK